MKAVSQRFKDSIPRPHRLETQVTAQVPGGDQIVLDITSCSISASGGTGTRKKAEIFIPAVDNKDIFELVSAPGTIFNIGHGFRYSSQSVELVDLFTGEATTGTSPLEDGSVQLSLTDRYNRVERSRFLYPRNPPAGKRAKTVADLMVDALGSVPEDVTTFGGSHTGSSTWERDRSQAIKDLCTDGGLEAYVDSDGAYGTVVVRKAPELDPNNVVAIIRSGDGGTLKAGSRSRPLDRLYNTVVVTPSDETQTWSAQVADITDPNHPRHPNKIGTVPYFWSSPTAGSASSAMAAAKSILARVLGPVDWSLQVDAVGDPSLEPGDVIQVVKSGPVGQSLSATHIIDGWTLDCITGGMTFDTRSTLDSVEEV